MFESDGGWDEYDAYLELSEKKIFSFKPIYFANK